MSQDCVIAITGYVISPHQDACGVSRPNYVPMAVVTMLSALVLALANGTHGMSFGHKSALVGLLLASAFVMVGVCGKDELVLMLCEIAAALVIGYAVAHMAEFFVRLSYAEKVMETRRVSKEKRLLEVRNQQLTAEKERLLYDVQRPGRPLADDDRSAKWPRPAGDNRPTLPRHRQRRGRERAIGVGAPVVSARPSIQQQHALRAA
jgi:hypothetical protein